MKAPFDFWTQQALLMVQTGKTTFEPELCFACNAVLLVGRSLSCPKCGEKVEEVSDERVEAGRALTVAPTIGAVATASLERANEPNAVPKTRKGRKSGQAGKGGRGYTSDRVGTLFEIADTRKARGLTPALASIYYRAAAGLQEIALSHADNIDKGGAGYMWKSDLVKVLKGSTALFAVGSAFEMAWAAKTWTEFGQALELSERLAILALSNPETTPIVQAFAQWCADRCNAILVRRGANIKRTDGTKPELPSPDVSDSAYIAGLVEFGDMVGGKKK